MSSNLHSRHFLKTNIFKPKIRNSPRYFYHSHNLGPAAGDIVESASVCKRKIVNNYTVICYSMSQSPRDLSPSIRAIKCTLLDSKIWLCLLLSATEFRKWALGPRVGPEKHVTVFHQPWLHSKFDAQRAGVDFHTHIPWFIIQKKSKNWPISTLPGRNCCARRRVNTCARARGMLKRCWVYTRKPYKIKSKFRHLGEHFYKMRT